MTAVRSTPLDAVVRAAFVALAVVLDLSIWTEDRELRGGGEVPYAIIPVLIVLVHATLLVRGRHPRSVLALEWTFSMAASLIVPLFQPAAGLLVALHAVSSRRPPRESAWWLAALALPFGVQSYNTSVVNTGYARTSFAILLLVWLLIGLAVWAVGRRHYASARRAWRHRELQAAEAVEAVQAERLRLARELHDIVSHGVTGMLLQAAGARALTRPTDERVRTALTVIEATGVQALSELHRMLGLLQATDPPTGSPSAEPGPVVADIATLVGLAADAGRNVRLVQVGAPGDLDPSVATAAYRVVQEALTNSSKYAGPEAEVEVELQWRTEALLVTVTDRSGGPPGACREVLSTGRGLPGLTERITLVGGALASGPTADGFSLTAWLPRPTVLPRLVSLDAVS